MSCLGLLSPAVATVLGWVVLGESLTAVQEVGFGLALVSIAAAQLAGATARSLLRRRPDGAPARNRPAADVDGRLPNP